MKVQLFFSLPYLSFTLTQEDWDMLLLYSGYKAESVAQSRGNLVSCSVPVLLQGQR